MKCLVFLTALLLTGCATSRYTLTKQAGRDLLLPPGVRPPSSNEPEAACSSSPGGVPITPRASHYSLYGCYIQTGYVDLQPGMRLRIVKPVTAKGEALQVGVKEQQDRTLTAKSNILGVDTQIVEPATLGLGPSITHYRLFFLARDLGRERKITLIGATTKDGLNDSSSNLEAHCQRKDSACHAVTEGMVIAPLIPVTVAGKLQYVALGATVREVLPNPAPQSSRLQRQWKGKLVAVQPQGQASPSLSSLPLNGGDSVLW